MNRGAHPENGERSGFEGRMCSLYAQDGTNRRDRSLASGYVFPACTGRQEREALMIRKKRRHGGHAVSSFLWRAFRICQAKLLLLRSSFVNVLISCFESVI